MASLKKPFTGKNHIQLGIGIKKGKFNRIPKRYSEDLQNIINSMLKLNAKMRPSAADFLTHPLNVLRKQQTQIFDNYEKLKKR